MAQVTPCPVCGREMDARRVLCPLCEQTSGEATIVSDNPASSPYERTIMEPQRLPAAGITAAPTHSAVSEPRSGPDQGAVWGIVLALLGWIPILGIFLAVAGIALGARSLVRQKYEPHIQGRGLAWAAIAIGVLMLIGTVCYGVVIHYINYFNAATGG